MSTTITTTPTITLPSSPERTFAHTVLLVDGCVRCVSYAYMVALDRAEELRAPKLGEGAEIWDTAQMLRYHLKQLDQYHVPTEWALNYIGARLAKLDMHSRNDALIELARLILA